MARYPSLSDYNAAILSPRRAFADPLLARGKAEVGGFGMPLALSGGFALTYRLRCPGGRQFAVRCFQEDQPGRAERYEIITRWIRGKRAPSGGEDCWVHTEYQAEGIRIDGGRYPIVKMDWVSGKTLGAFLEENYRSSKVIDTLRRDMRRLAAALEEQEAAHGDVQNGNVLWTGSGLKLIDYDGMFAPGMAALSGCEAGHPNFQHPGRTASHFGQDIDRFSFILYDISLHALSRNPELYEKYSTGENILFSRVDMQLPADSAVFQTVGAEPGLEREVAVFQRICEAPFEEVPNLSEYLLELSAGKVYPVLAPRRAQGEAADSGQPPPVSPAGAALPPYAGPYPVYDARNFAGLCAVTGRKVEAVGCVGEVKAGLTRSDKPYVFINFGRWREDIFQITIWSEGLENFKEPPDDTLVGRWVSVVGLVDQPYTNERFGYTHAGITVHHPSQMRIIEAGESAYRLGKRKKMREADSRRSVTHRRRAFPAVDRSSVDERTSMDDRASIDGRVSIDNKALVRDLVEGNPQAPRIRRPPGNSSGSPRDFKPPKRFWWFVLRIAGGVLVIVLVYVVISVLLR